MVKYIIVIMNILSLHVAHAFFATDPSVKVNAPSHVKRGEDFTVSLTINKGSISGIGHMKQILPAAFGNATIVEAKGAEFKYLQEGNVVKFIWISLPVNQEFIVSYKVKVNTNASIGNVTLGGIFFYIVNNQKQTFSIPDISITVGEEIPAATTTQPEKKIITTKEPETSAATVNQQKKATTITTEAEKNSSNLGIVFKVQIGAFKEPAPIDISSKFLRIAKQEVKTEKDKTGLIIYTVGEFSEYESANNLKAKLIYDGLNGAFVIAFQNGKKMTASAALELIKNR